MLICPLKFVSFVLSCNEPHALMLSGTRFETPCIDSQHSIKEPASNSMASLFYISKIVFFILLLVICLFGFGRPSLKKFLAQKVSFEESTEENKDLKPPAITLCARVPAWKGSRHIGMEGHFKRQCPNETDTQGFRTCMENQTFGFDELVEKTVRGFGPRQEDISLDYWTWDMPLPALGRCFTFTFNKSLTFNMETDSLLVFLKKNISYLVFFHQPDFFTMSMNPLALPVKSLHIVETVKIDENTLFHTLQVGTQNDNVYCIERHPLVFKGTFWKFSRWLKRERLNRAEAPCNPAPASPPVS